MVNLVIVELILIILKAHYSFCLFASCLIIHALTYRISPKGHWLKQLSAWVLDRRKNDQSAAKRG